MVTPVTHIQTSTTIGINTVYATRKKNPKDTVGSCCSRLEYKMLEYPDLYKVVGKTN